ncbi:hypothetical protein CEK28_10410 [Xenophilus sp. AP218F]|nr:hypothetical protein CEK28_10410 [Xenophilus sp. AP218F]
MPGRKADHRNLGGRVSHPTALPQAANPAPALHNLALLEMLTGDAPRAEDILAALEAVEPDHPKTRSLRARFNDWQSRFVARQGWDPARARCEDTGLALSPLMPHHAENWPGPAATATI